MIDAVGTSSAETLFSVCPVVFGTPVDVDVGVGKSVDHVVPISGPSFDVDASRGSTVNDSVGTWRSQAVTRVIIVRFTLQPPSLVHDDAMSVVYVQSDSELDHLRYRWERPARRRSVQYALVPLFRSVNLWMWMSRLYL